MTHGIELPNSKPFVAKLAWTTAKTPAALLQSVYNAELGPKTTSCYSKRTESMPSAGNATRQKECHASVLVISVADSKHVPAAPSCHNNEGAPQFS